MNLERSLFLLDMKISSISWGYEDAIYIDGDIIIEGKEEGSAQLYFKTEGRNIKVTDVVLP